MTFKIGDKVRVTDHYAGREMIGATGVIVRRGTPFIEVHMDDPQVQAKCAKDDGVGLFNADELERVK